MQHLIVNGIYIYIYITSLGVGINYLLLLAYLYAIHVSHFQYIQKLVTLHTAALAILSRIMELINEMLLLILAIHIRYQAWNINSYYQVCRKLICKYKEEKKKS